MVNWSAIQALKPEHPVKLLAKQNPEFFEKYAGQEDEFGFNIKTFALWEHIFCFCFEEYFKIKVEGIENIPADGRVLVVGNHSGLMPADGCMLTVALCRRRPNPRRIRFLSTDWFFSVPGLKEWAMCTGQVRATLENAKTLLDSEEIVGVYPEGLRGVGKTFAERYRVHDFHPGFVQLAIATQTPIVPVATIGGDEIYPNFVNIKSLSRMLKMPFFPLTLTFPWLPVPWPFLPLPVRWLMKIHKPIYLDYPPEKANDKKLTLSIAREIQYTIQQDLNNLLRERKSVFTGWEE